MPSAPLVSVVDDDESVRESLRGLMRSVGLRVEVFASAEEFLSSDHLGDTDCVILDVRMPGISGPELHHQLATSGRAIPVIFITAHASDEEVRARAFNGGAVDYLIKPFSDTSLLVALDRALRSR